jgi:putative transposase
MKYVFIEKHQAEFSIKTMSRVLRVARSGWYIWEQRRVKLNSRQQFRLRCDSVVHDAFHRAKQRYGAPRLTDELHAQGYRFNVKTVAASLRRQALRAKASRKFSPVSYRELFLDLFTLRINNAFTIFFSECTALLISQNIQHHL